MSKNVQNTESKVNSQATPEQIAEYKKLKARNEWIKMNQERMDEIERKRLFSVRLLIILVIVNLIINLIGLL